MVGDDDPVLLRETTQILRDAGYLAYATYNGYATYQATTFVADLSLLITNTRLSGISAAELIRRVRASRRDLPVLHLGTPFAAEEGLPDVPTLAEPFTADQLLRLVEKLRTPRG